LISSFKQLDRSISAVNLNLFAKSERILAGATQSYALQACLLDRSLSRIDQLLTLSECGFVRELTSNSGARAATLSRKPGTQTRTAFANPGTAPQPPCSFFPVVTNPSRIFSAVCGLLFEVVR
jgi:hypothetical protein